jgi:nitroreductase
VTDFFEVVSRQRACRSFSDVPVSDESIGRVLTAATFAPSAENKQPWEFIVVRDGPTRIRIGDESTDAFQVWARHPELRIMYVNTFARVGARSIGEMA